MDIAIEIVQMWKLRMLLLGFCRAHGWETGPYEDRLASTEVEENLAGGGGGR